MGEGTGFVYVVEVTLYDFRVVVVKVFVTCGYDIGCNFREFVAYRFVKGVN